MADDGPHAGFQIQYTAGAARRLFRMLLCAEVILAAAYIFAHIIAPGLRLGPIRNFLNVDREVSIPTWFSATQLFFLAAVLWSHALQARQVRFFFAMLACVFLFLSLDEAVAVHDSLFRAARDHKFSLLEGREYLAWMVPYAAAGLGCLLFGFRPAVWIARACPREAAYIAAGAALFAGGAVGIEILTHFLYRIAVDDRFFLAVAAEEFCEMAGVSLMLYGFLLLGIGLRSQSSG